jgi:hypothetical protein
LKKIQAQIKSAREGVNSYMADYYDNNKDQVERLESDINSYLNQNSTESKETP